VRLQTGSCRKKGAGNIKKSVSNWGFLRIILNGNWYQTRIFEKVDNEFGQKSWAGFAEGDAEVWREFISREIPRLYGMFMRRWPNPSLAEELVQKTVFDAVRGCESFDASKGSPEEWVFGIARNNIRLEIRRRASRPSVDGDISIYIEKIDTEPLPDEVLEQKETAVIVRAALARLESKEQAALKAKYIEGLPAVEIARRMSITEKAVHSLLYRARNSLRAELERMAPLSKEEQKL
jgi:RNA polymerase sigma-70 factor (ECF subfamily)